MNHERTIIRCNASHLDFIALVKDLDASLAISDGDQHAFYDQYNKLDDIKHCLILYIDNLPVACGAIKAFSKTSMEVKRMYTHVDHRGKGFASQLLKQLEIWALELGYKSCVLETGLKQPEAIALYHKNNYQVISNYGQYAGVENSVCFEKILS